MKSVNKKPNTVRNRKPQTSPSLPGVDGSHTYSGFTSPEYRDQFSWNKWQLQRMDSMALHSYWFPRLKDFPPQPLTSTLQQFSKLDLETLIVPDILRYTTLQFSLYNIWIVLYFSSPDWPWLYLSSKIREKRAQLSMYLHIFWSSWTLCTKTIFLVHC